MKCVSEEYVGYVIREVHRGIGGNHKGGMALAQKNHETRYFLTKDLFEKAKLAIDLLISRGNLIRSYKHIVYSVPFAEWRLI